MYAAMPTAEARRIEQQVAGLQCEFRVDYLTDVKGASAESPPADAIVELWVHPEDDVRLRAKLRATDDGPPTPNG
jgi:hypothetical protein